MKILLFIVALVIIYLAFISPAEKKKVEEKTEKALEQIETTEKFILQNFLKALTTICDICDCMAFRFLGRRF